MGPIWSILPCTIILFLLILMRPLRPKPAAVFVRETSPICKHGPGRVLAVEAVALRLVNAVTTTSRVWIGHANFEAPTASYRILPTQPTFRSFPGFFRTVSADRVGSVCDSQNSHHDPSTVSDYPMKTRPNVTPKQGPQPQDSELLSPNSLGHDPPGAGAAGHPPGAGEKLRFRLGPAIRQPGLLHLCKLACRGGSKSL